MNFEIITGLHEIGSFMKSFVDSTVLGFDVETSSLDWITCRLYSVQVAIGEDIFVFDCTKFKEVEYLAGLLSSKKLVGHNIKYDSKVILAKTGVVLPDVYDTMLGEVLIHQGIGNKFYSLDDLVKYYFNVELEKGVRESFYTGGLLDDLTYEQLLYSALDVKYLVPMMEKQVEMLSRQKQLRVMELEMKLIPAISSMEHVGIKLDQDHWIEIMNNSLAKAKEIEGVLRKTILDIFPFDNYINQYELAKAVRYPVKTKRDILAFTSITEKSFFRDFMDSNMNLSSPTQLLAILNILGIGVDSTGEKVLKEYRGNNEEIIKLILDFREHYKKGNAFGQSFLDKIHPSTGRLHAEFNQLMADTGRFSSSNPNLQQIPRDKEYRKAFVARPGYKIITTDYSQQELRLAGAITKEPLFIKAYNENIDMHTLTGSILYNIPIEEVTSEQRNVAKTFNFAVLYGSSEYGLAYNFGVDLRYAKDMLDKYYSGYPTLAYFKEKMEDAILERGYSSTPLGRKRFFEKKTVYKDSWDMVRTEGGIKRQGFNHIIQGAGADITKQAIVYMFFSNPFGDAFYIVMTVHDEIVCEVREDVVDEAKEFIINCMLDAERPYLGEIPAEVSSKVDYSWTK